MKAGMLLIAGAGLIVVLYLVFIFGVQPFRLSVMAARVRLVFPDNAAGLYSVQFGSDTKAKSKNIVIDFSEGRVRVGNEYSLLSGPVKITASLVSGSALPVAFQGETGRRGKSVWVMNAPLRNERYFFVGDESEFEAFFSKERTALYGP